MHVKWHVNGGKSNNTHNATSWGAITEPGAAELLPDIALSLLESSPLDIGEDGPRCSSLSCAVRSLQRVAQF